MNFASRPDRSYHEESSSNTHFPTIHLAEGQPVLGEQAWIETLEQQLTHVPPGAHICPIYDTPDEHFRAITSFLRAGIDSGELCLYIGDNAAADDLVERGIASAADVTRGALVVLPERETYMRGQSFDADLMLERWNRWVDTARDRGFAGVRVCGWATWALDAKIDMSGFIRYEARLADFLAATGCRVMCHYLFPRFSASIMQDVLRTHPLAIIGEHVHDNVYFEPPALILGSPETDRQRLDWMRERLRAHARREIALANLSRLALAGASTPDLVRSVAQFVAAELEVDLVEIGELVPGDDLLRVVASAGGLATARQHAWQIGVDHGDERDMLLFGKPLIVADWRDESRYQHVRPETSPPIISSVCVAIRADQAEPAWGVLSVHSARPHLFSEDEVVLLESVALALAHALDRKRREDQFRALVEHAPDAIVRVDKNLRIQYVNPTFERLTGRPEQHLVGAPVDTESLLQPMFGSWDVLLRQVLRTGREQTAEYTLETPRRARLLQGRIVPEFSPTTGREVQSLMIVARDITDFAQAQDERERLARELLERERRHQEWLERLVASKEHENRQLRHARVLQDLSAREREILRRIALGQTNVAIARELHLSPGTVKNHITHLLRKLGVADRAQAAARAGEMGLVSSHAS